MPRSKEIPEDIRRKVVEAHESGKGYKLISKAIGLPKTTIRAILRKWKRFGTVVTLPRSGRPPKISPRARREIIREVMKNPCTTSKDLQATLASSNICVHQSTIRRILGIHGRPTLSSIEGSMALSGQEEEETCNAVDGAGQGVKNPEEGQVPENTNSAKGKFLNNTKESGGRDKHNKNKEEVENENRVTDTLLTDVNGTGGGGSETAMTRRSRDDGRDRAETSRNTYGGGGADERRKRGVETAAGTSGRRGDSGGANGNNNNNSAGNWSEEMDYISRLTFT